MILTFFLYLGPFSFDSRVALFSLGKFSTPDLEVVLMPHSLAPLPVGHLHGSFLLHGHVSCGLGRGRLRPPGLHFSLDLQVVLVSHDGGPVTARKRLLS